jgi:Mrp family chromosome partitioning ATPase
VEASRRLHQSFSVVPAGRATTPPLIATAATRQRFAQFIAQFDHVVVNVEPVQPGGTVAALLRLVEGVIVIVDADSTRREIARRATQALRDSGVSVIGAVITNRRFPIPNAVFRLL